MYPLKFHPILKPILWGGEDICKFKNIQPRQSGIGESWELSGIAGNISVVNNGDLKGKNLSELMTTYGEKLLGKPAVERFGNTFPLLIKFIDARQPLSIQVHPNDELAKQRHNSFGKTEMWYVVKANQDAYLYSGFKEQMDAATYVQSLQDDTFINYLQKQDVKAGDVFFLPAGRVHAIGTGCFIAEIQQTSDITYRIYDYNRKDANGCSRELHTELAKDAIDYKIYPDYKVDYSPGKKERQRLVRCPYFTTNLITGKEGNTFDLDYSQDSFVIFICLTGNVRITDSENHPVVLQEGETVLIPAANIHPVRLEFTHNSQLLETYIE
ncbi:mannose-6-phosphate isomerase [Bacteroidia bacterium]|nr:mannose-6-phosphate isomerase [Bacteroidia bacterium]